MHSWQETLRGLSREDVEQLCALAVEQIAQALAERVIEEEKHAQAGGVLLQGIDEEG